MDLFSVKKKTFLIAGGSGLIGSELRKYLPAQGHEVRVLTTKSRLADRQNGFFFWDPDHSIIDTEAFQNLDYLVNLAGVSIGGGRWSKTRKKHILESRVCSSGFLFESMKKNQIRPELYFGASAMGFYGPSFDNEGKKEEDDCGRDFLSMVCKAWEGEHQKFARISDRVIIGRMSNVLTSRGGILTPFIKLASHGIRLKIGADNRPFSWIHIEDVCRFIEESVFRPFNGIYNISVGSVPWDVFQKGIYKHFSRRWIRIPIPSLCIRIAMGEMSTLLLNGNAISGDKLEREGFMLKYVDMDYTLGDISDETA